MLELLQKHAFPCSEPVLASATPTEYGIELSGSWVDMDMLVGFVAGEANYARKKNRTGSTGSWTRSRTRWRWP